MHCSSKRYWMARMGLIQLSINDRWSDWHLACQQLALVKFNGLTIQTENIIETEPAGPSLHSSINLLLEHWHPQVNHLDEFLQAWCQYLHRSPWWQRSQESTNFSCSSSGFIASLLWRPIVVLSIQLCPIFAFANFKTLTHQGNQRVKTNLSSSWIGQGDPKLDSNPVTHQILVTIPAPPSSRPGGSREFRQWRVITWSFMSMNGRLMNNISIFPLSTTEHSSQTISPVSDLRSSTRFSCWGKLQRIGVDHAVSERRSCATTTSVQAPKTFFSGWSLQWQFVNSSILGRCEFSDHVRDSRGSDWTATGFVCDFRPVSASGTRQCRPMMWLCVSRIT